jgi:heme-degrading monooxygenase HmoA
MIAVIFEAFPKEGKWEEYLDIAASLRSELNKIEGFISIERFQSMTNKEKVLSLSFWRDDRVLLNGEMLSCTARHKQTEEAASSMIIA